MKNKVIAFITHTHTSESNKNSHINTHTRNNTLTLVATVCKNIKKMNSLNYTN